MNSSTKNVIASFEDFVNEAAGEFRADIKKIGGGHIELKSWSVPYINGIKSRSLTAQLGNYFNQTADFIQVFDFKRMNSSIAEFATKAKALETITKQYEDLFKKDGAFDALGGVNSKYLIAAGITNETQFNQAVSNLNPTLHNKLFEFIKVE